MKLINIRLITVERMIEDSTMTSEQISNEHQARKNSFWQALFMANQIIDYNPMVLACYWYIWALRRRQYVSPYQSASSTNAFTNRTWTIFASATFITFLRIASKSSHQDIKVSGANSQVIVSELGLRHANGTAVQKVMNSVGKTTSQAIQSGGDILTAPAIWLKEIQQNWLSYMIVTAIILSILTFFYCTVCFYLNRKKNNSFNGTLIELAKVIGNNYRHQWTVYDRFSPTHQQNSKFKWKNENFCKTSWIFVKS